jgi:hypothetical protein
MQASAGTGTNWCENNIRQKKLHSQIQQITSLTQVSMITTLVRVEPVKRYSTKYHKGFTASAGEKRVVRLRRKSSPTMLLKKLKKALGQ